jgi:hypothetical protein
MQEHNNIPKEAPDDMLEQADRLLFHELVDHVAEYSTDSIKALVGLTDVGKPNVVEEDLLYDENCDGFAELRPSLHDAQAKGDDLGRQKKVDDFRGIVLD